MRLYLIRYYFEWGNGERHGVLIPRGIYLGNGKIDYSRQAWTFAEASVIVERLCQGHGENSHWIVRERDGLHA